MHPSKPQQRIKKRSARIAVVNEDEKVQASPPTTTGTISTAIRNTVVSNNRGNTNHRSHRYEHILRPRKKQNRSSAPSPPFHDQTTIVTKTSSLSNIVLPPTTSPQKKSKKKKNSVFNNDALIPTSTDQSIQHYIPTRIFSRQTRSKSTSTPTHPTVLPIVTPHHAMTVVSTNTCRKIKSDTMNINKGKKKNAKYADPKINVNYTKLPPGVINIFPEKICPTCSATNTGTHHPSMVPVQRRNDFAMYWSSDYLSTYGHDYLFLINQQQHEQILIDTSRRRQIQMDVKRTTTITKDTMTKFDSSDDDSDDLSTGNASFGNQKRFSKDVNFDDDNDDDDCDPARHQLDDANSSTALNTNDVEAKNARDVDETQPSILDRPFEQLGSLSSDNPQNLQSMIATPTRTTDDAIVVGDHLSSGSLYSVQQIPTKRQYHIPKSSVAILNQPLLTTKMRRTLVLWMSEVCQEYHLSDETYHLSVTLVDQTLLYNTFQIRSGQFQALGCVCLWIASKLEDVKSPSRDELSYISDFSVSDGQLLCMERHICSLLQFRLQLVTPLHFIPIYLRASSANDSTSSSNTFAGYDPIDVPMVSMVKYLLELSRSSYRLTKERPDLIAASCVYLARATLGIVAKGKRKEPKMKDLYWTNTLQHYTGYDTTDLVYTIIAIGRLQITAESAVSMGVGGCPAYTKYGTKDHYYVSRKVPPRLEDLGFPNLEIDYEDYFKPDIWGIDMQINTGN